MGGSAGLTYNPTDAGPCPTSLFPQAIRQLSEHWPIVSPIPPHADSKLVRKRGRRWVPAASGLLEQGTICPTLPPAPWPEGFYSPTCRVSSELQPQGRAGCSPVLYHEKGASWSGKMSQIRQPPPVTVAAVSPTTGMSMWISIPHASTCPDKCFQAEWYLHFNVGIHQWKEKIRSHLAEIKCLLDHRSQQQRFPQQNSSRHCRLEATAF